MNILYIHSEIYYAVRSNVLPHLMHAAKPDFLFLNINLPGLDGFKYLKKLRLITGTALVPVFIYNAFNNVQLIDNCFHLKANKFIIKPNELEKLINLFKKVFAINWLTDKFPLKRNFVIQ